jgi:hypothetical protein
MREPVRAESLHAAALVVDGDEDVGTQRLHFGRDLGELAAVLPVAGEEDQAARERMLQAAAVVLVEAVAGNVEDDGGMVHVGDFGSLCSTTTYDVAYSDSSLTDTCAARLRASHQAASAPCRRMVGLPVGSLRISQARHVIGIRMPRPIALENASLAEKRVAR